jgi:hypothetical protein
MLTAQTNFTYILDSYQNWWPIRILTTVIALTIVVKWGRSFIKLSTASILYKLILKPIIVLYIFYIAHMILCNNHCRMALFSSYFVAAYAPIDTLLYIYPEVAPYMSIETARNAEQEIWTAELNSINAEDIFSYYKIKFTDIVWRQEQLLGRLFAYMSPLDALKLLFKIMYPLFIFIFFLPSPCNDLYSVESPLGYRLFYMQGMGQLLSYFISDSRDSLPNFSKEITIEFLNYWIQDLSHVLQSIL